MRISLKISFAVVVVLGSIGFAQTNSGPNPADTSFIKKASQGGMTEIALGQLAVKKASNPKVKDLGQRMVEDHTKTNDQLKQLASEKNIDLPKHMSMKERATETALAKLSGPEFDRQYIDDMVKDHKKDVMDFKLESTTATDADVKSFAAQTLPTLQDHLKQAESIVSTVSASR